MEELVSSLAANRGVMRNPLSKALFSPADVKAITQHSLGQGLSKMQSEQGRMVRGVRPRTVDKIKDLGTALLADQTTDQTKSRRALDEFLNYKASLLPEEQRILDELRVPARDSHSGFAFDESVGEAVQDALSSKVCMHKTGRNPSPLCSAIR